MDSKPLIRPAWSAADVDAVHRLTHDAFVERGYAAPTADGRLRYSTDIEVAPETMVLIADVGGAVAGSVSVTVDGAAGLHVDRHFGAECRRVRAEGRPVACVWRLVVGPVQRADRALAFRLGRAATEVLHAFGVGTALSEFHPRHERPYRRLFGAAVVARRDWIDDVRSPGLLVRFDVAAAFAQWPADGDLSLLTLVAERGRLLDVLGRPRPVAPALLSRQPTAGAGRTAIAPRPAAGRGVA